MFYFGGGHGYDRIKDFEDGIDKVDLTDFGFAGFSEVMASAVQYSAAVRLELFSGDMLLIEGTVLAQGTIDDFIL